MVRFTTSTITIAVVLASFTGCVTAMLPPPEPSMDAADIQTPAGPWMSCFATPNAATGEVVLTVMRTPVPVTPGWNPDDANMWLPGEAARGQFNDTMHEVGWSYLYIATNPSASNQVQAQAAGYMEGKLSATRIYQYGINSGANATVPQNIQEFLSKSNDWLTTQIKANPHSDYWQQVDLWRRQVYAIQQGFNDACTGVECSMKPDFVLAINLGATIGTLAAKFDVLAKDPDHHPSLLTKDDGKCTGFVKLLPGNKELYTGQDTWTSLNSMTRVYKTIDTAFKRVNGDIIPGRRQAFSSYPGSAFSGDDYYTLSSGLTVCETTIGTNNHTSYELITFNTVFESARNVVANRLASTGEEWTTLFAANNNGCYNNQFYVVDYNRFTPGSTPESGTLWVLEQLPGYAKSKDLTHMLIEQGYFGSYNLAMFPETLALNNNSALVKEYGVWFTYNHTARANMMRRSHASITTIDAMKSFMRYNDFKHDPLARCPCDPPYTGENAIACRSDLNPADGTYNIPAFKQRNHAATDSKFTTHAFMNQGGRTWAISSPTYVQQPVFVWSTSPYADVPHIGQPERWEFPWVAVGFNNDE